jgi:hypothetical protein
MVQSWLGVAGGLLAVRHSPCTSLPFSFSRLLCVGVWMDRFGLMSSSWEIAPPTYT